LQLLPETACNCLQLPATACNCLQLPATACNCLQLLQHAQQRLAAVVANINEQLYTFHFNVT
jgi:hypothetical protein